MVHITPPNHLQDFARYSAFDLGLEVDEEVYVIERTGREVVFLNWARWRGRVIIQRLEQVPEYDNTIPRQQDVQTWLDGIQGRGNTTDVPLVEPTIRLPKDNNGNLVSWRPVVDIPVLENGFLKLTVDESGPGVTSPVVKHVGDVLKVGNPNRMYKLYDVTGSNWFLTPGIIPKGTQGNTNDDLSNRIPLPATSLKVKIITPLSQRRSKGGRGGWDAEFIEVIE